MRVADRQQRWHSENQSRELDRSTQRSASSKHLYDLRSRRDSNARPLASEGTNGAVQRVPTVAFSSVGGGLGGPSAVQPSQGVGTLHGNSVPNEAPKLPRALRLVEGGVGDLLTVREVAKRLRVSTATVYALVERGELAHLRVSNAIRVRRADLEGYVSK